jgi:hypothetical protein
MCHKKVQRKAANSLLLRFSENKQQPLSVFLIEAAMLASLNTITNTQIKGRAHEAYIKLPGIAKKYLSGAASWSDFDNQQHYR